MALNLERGDRVQIRKTASRTGEYGPYRGEKGTVLQRCGTASVHLRLDSGKQLEWVQDLYLTKERSEEFQITNDTDDITRETLEGRKEKLEKALKRVNVKLEFLDDTDSNIFSEKLFKAHKITRLASSGKEEDRNSVAELIADLL